MNADEMNNRYGHTGIRMAIGQLLAELAMNYSKEEVIHSASATVAVLCDSDSHTDEETKLNREIAEAGREFGHKDIAEFRERLTRVAN